MSLMDVPMYTKYKVHNNNQTISLKNLIKQVKEHVTIIIIKKEKKKKKTQINLNKTLILPLSSVSSSGQKRMMGNYLQSIPMYGHDNKISMWSCSLEVAPMLGQKSQLDTLVGTSWESYFPTCTSAHHSFAYKHGGKMQASSL